MNKLDLLKDFLEKQQLGLVPKKVPVHLQTGKVTEAIRWVKPQHDTDLREIDRLKKISDKHELMYELEKASNNVLQAFMHDNRDIIRHVVAAYILKDSVGKVFDGDIIFHGNLIGEDIDIPYEYNISDKSLNLEYVKVHKALTRQILDIAFPDTNIFVLYRGTSEIKDIDKLANGDRIKITQNPISSWTLKKSVARNFALEAGANGKLLKTIVNKDEIWSTFATHAYKGNETEILLINRKGGREVENIGIYSE
ncbi:hypothetical protein HYS94_01875 [Candidatus Daviesbacteria bacterium]|nr:hypothetical protein [Candidatus Daviesbacteria bacterium]